MAACRAAGAFANIVRLLSDLLWLFLIMACRKQAGSSVSECVIVNSNESLFYLFIRLAKAKSSRMCAVKLHAASIVQVVSCFVSEMGHKQVGLPSR